MSAIFTAQQSSRQTPCARCLRHTPTATNRSICDFVSSLRADISSASARETTARGARVLLCVTGSVAAIRSRRVASALKANPRVSRVVVAASRAAFQFLDLDEDADDDLIISDDAEWVTWTKLGDPVLHIELRSWADVLVIAPLSANSLAKIAGGFCDNLITCIARAWPVGQKPFVVAPAMNTAMWEHPITTRQLETVQQPGFDVKVVPPVSKTLACGDVGIGAMASPESIAQAVAREIDSLWQAK